MPKKKKKKKKKRTRRAAAWIYAVLNPVIDALQRERDFLERKNLTWRFSSGQSEFIRPIQEYVDPSQWPNYQDFVAENAPFGKTLKGHDERLAECNSEVTKTFKWLLSVPDFINTIHKMAAEYTNEVGPRAFTGHPSADDFPQFCAEYVINNISDLPSHYTLSAFWNSHNIPLLSFRGDPEFVSFAEMVEALCSPLIN